jgi:plastocyanin
VRARSFTALAALAGALSMTSASAQALRDVSVAIVDAPRPLQRWGYAPATSRIDPGAWVTWSNAGEDVHSITAVDGSFDSGDLLPSEGFSWYFDQPGTFEYLCTLHPWMVGRVVVGDGVAIMPDEPPVLEEGLPEGL